MQHWLFVAWVFICEMVNQFIQLFCSNNKCNNGCSSAAFSLWLFVCSCLSAAFLSVADHLQLFICGCSYVAVHLLLFICGCLSAAVLQLFVCEMINQLVLYKVHNCNDQDLTAADKHLGNSNHKDDEDVQDDEEFHDFVLLTFLIPKYQFLQLTLFLLENNKPILANLIFLLRGDEEACVKPR